MWSKIPKVKPGDTRLRCKIHVNREAGLVPCDRPAKRYGQQVKAFWLKGQTLDTGLIDCCSMHAEKLERQGVVLTEIDRRKRVPGLMPP